MKGNIFSIMGSLRQSMCVAFLAYTHFDAPAVDDNDCEDSDAFCTLNENRWKHVLIDDKYQAVKAALMHVALRGMHI